MAFDRGVRQMAVTGATPTHEVLRTHKDCSRSCAATGPALATIVHSVTVGSRRRPRQLKGMKHGGHHKRSHARLRLLPSPTRRAAGTAAAGTIAACRARPRVAKSGDRHWSASFAPAPWSPQWKLVAAQARSSEGFTAASSWCGPHSRAPFAD